MICDARKMHRVLSALLLALLISAVFFWREPVGLGPNDQRVRFRDLMPALAKAGPLKELGPLKLTGAWQLRANNADFGGYSALGQRGDGRFVAISDRNSVLIFDPPGTVGPASTTIRKLFTGDPRQQKQEKDAEALAIDPATGEIWTAFEDAESYWVFKPDFSSHRRVPAPVLVEWPGNAGPEAMARLMDGRFVVMIEARTSLLSRSRHPALLYPQAPRPNEVPVRFTVEMPAGFRPTDAAPLPDGRLLVLGRDWGISGYRSVVGVLDTARMRPGAVVPLQELGQITERRISDNYEALMVLPNRNGSLTIWLMSDNNQSLLLQRTLLLRLEWQP